jgi:hypothetical protein
MTQTLMLLIVGLQLPIGAATVTCPVPEPARGSAQLLLMVSVTELPFEPVPVKSVAAV